MSDLIHTHLTVGFVDGCPACAQLAADLEHVQAGGIQLAKA